jgi:hypothetical protein
MKPGREQIYSPTKKRKRQCEEEGCLEHSTSDLCYCDLHDQFIVESMVSYSGDDKKCIFLGCESNKDIGDFCFCHCTCIEIESLELEPSLYHCLDAVKALRQPPPYQKHPNQIPGLLLEMSPTMRKGLPRILKSVLRHLRLRPRRPPSNLPLIQYQRSVSPCQSPPSISGQRSVSPCHSAPSKKSEKPKKERGD